MNTPPLSAPPAIETQWSRIHRLSRPEAATPTDRRAWEEAWLYLWDTFRPAMLNAVRRHLGRIGGGVVRPEDAEDVVQSFFLACLEHDYLARANAQIGRFRTFAVVCLRRHATKYVEHHRRQRRAPASPPRSLDAAGFDVADAGTAAGWDETFEEEWVRCVLEAALPRVGKRSERNEHLLRLLYAEPHLGISDVALRLDEEPSKIPLRLHRARKMLAEEFWNVVKETVSDEGQLEEERARMATLLARHLEERHAPSLFGQASLG